MSIRHHVIATMVLFVLVLAYGYQAWLIPQFPGQELESFRPRTMPVLLAAAGLLLTAMRLAGLDWPPALWLCTAMLGYGLLMEPLGFVLATTLFLLAGFLILGERRRGVLIVLPLAFSVAFFLLMTAALGLYLAPGAWMAN